MKSVIVILMLAVSFSNLVFADGEKTVLSEERREALKRIISGEVSIDDADVRANAVYQLIGLGKGEDVPFVLPYLESDADKHVKSAIIDMVSFWGDESIVTPALMKTAMNDSSIDVRAAAISALIRRKKEQEAMTLTESLIDELNGSNRLPNWTPFDDYKTKSVREEAKKYLEKLKKSEHSSIIIKAYAILNLSNVYDVKIIDSKSVIAKAIEEGNSGSVKILLKLLAKKPNDEKKVKKDILKKASKCCSQEVSNEAEAILKELRWSDN